ncbi:hypothetical protein N7461_003272 [Penicillium sp. DV-2018c]|nr:hypothetical protein N7461_003272 [Penicillium sp. DV-2018c]
MESTNVSAVKGVKLQSPEQWPTWISTIRSLAKDHKVWELLDPEKSDDEITKEIDEPELPPMPQQAMNETNQMMYRM